MSNTNIDKYFESARQIITESAHYGGEDIKKINILNILYVNTNIINEIKQHVKNKDFYSFLNDTLEDKDSDNLIEVFIAEDIISNYFFGLLYDSKQLFLDKELLAITSISKEEYYKLDDFSGSKGTKQFR